MWLLCKRIFFLTALVLATHAALWWLLPLDQNHYFAATIDKHKRLEQTPSPKLVLVGGSNLACGVDTEKLQIALGRPVVNMGLHADIGLTYMLAEVKDQLSSGDVVVIIPEYEQFFGILNGNMSLIKVVSYYPKGWGYIQTPHQGSVFVLQGFNYVQGKLKYSLEEFFHVPRDHSYEIYHRSGFNAYGDMVTHLDLAHTSLEEITIKPLRQEKYDGRGVDTINRFAQNIRGKGVATVLMYPCYNDRMLSKNEKALKIIAADFLRLQIPVIGSAKEYGFPEDCFFDTEYHMNRKGRTLRTEKMIEDLQKALQY